MSPPSRVVKATGMLRRKSNKPGQSRSNVAQALGCLRRGHRQAKATVRTMEPIALEPVDALTVTTLGRLGRVNMPVLIHPEFSSRRRRLAFPGRDPVEP